MLGILRPCGYSYSTTCPGLTPAIVCARFRQISAHHPSMKIERTLPPHKSRSYRLERQLHAAANSTVHLYIDVDLLNKSVDILLGGVDPDRSSAHGVSEVSLIFLGY